MAVVVGISSGRDVGIYTRRGNKPNKSKLALYKPLIHCNSRLNVRTREPEWALKRGSVTRSHERWQ